MSKAAAFVICAKKESGGLVGGRKEICRTGEDGERRPVKKSGI